VAKEERKKRTPADNFVSPSPKGTIVALFIEPSLIVEIGDCFRVLAFWRRPTRSKASVSEMANIEIEFL